jgi:hypothetical protein
MPIKSKYLFVASMDVDPDKEALFNEVYDTEHVPNLLKVPGVHAVTRLEGEPFAMSIGGQEKRSRTKARATRPFTRSTARMCWSARNGPRRSKPAAGRRKCGHSPATAAIRCTGSGEAGVAPPVRSSPRRRGPSLILKRTGFPLSRE